MRSERSRISSSSLEISSTPTPSTRRAAGVGRSCTRSRRRRGLGSAGPQRGHRGVWRELACEHDPLLVATRERPHRCVGTRALDVELVDHARREPGRVRRGSITPRSAALARIDQDEVLGHRHVEHDARVVTILGDDGDAGRGPSRPARRVDTSTPSTPNRARSSGSRLDSRSARAALPVALDSGDADDLAGRTSSDKSSRSRTPALAADRRGAVDDEHRAISTAASAVGSRRPRSGARRRLDHRPDRGRRARSAATRSVRPSPRASVASIGRQSVVSRSTTRPWRMIVTSSVAVQHLVELVADEHDGAMPSAATTWRSDANS